MLLAMLLQNEATLGTTKILFLTSILK